MALLFMDSFDHYATADLLEKWTQSGVTGTGSGTAIAAGNGRHSSASLRWTTGTGTNPQGWVQKLFGSGQTTLILGFAFRTSGLPGSSGLQIAAFDGVGFDTQITLRLNADLKLSVLRGPHGGGTVLGTTVNPLIAATYAYLELKVFTANTGGTVDLRVDGASVLTLTGQDTQHTTATFGGIILGQINNLAASNAASRTLDYDDLYVLDGTGAAPLTDVLGDCRVDVRTPTAAGATTGWTPNTGANWAAVDDAAPNDDTDYTSAASVGLTDTFVTQDTAISGAVIYGLQHCLNLKKTDAGVCTVVPVVRHGGVDYAGTAILPGTAYAYGLQISTANPGTGAAWTEAGFNAAEFGYKRTV